MEYGKGSVRGDGKTVPISSEKTIKRVVSHRNRKDLEGYLLY